MDFEIALRYLRGFVPAYRNLRVRSEVSVGVKESALGNVRLRRL